MNRWAAKADANQHLIVDALKAIGCSVYYIREPTDLLVGFRKRSLVLEIKQGKNWRLTPAQEKFWASYRGEGYIVQSVAEALRAVTGK